MSEALTGAVSAPVLFQAENLYKSYGGVRALQGAGLVCAQGRIHAVLGENGAGKSTLIKIMSGVTQPDSGRMVLEGHEVRFRDPAAAVATGIVSVFQERSLVPDLSVADHLFLGAPPRRFGMIDRRAQRRMAEEALARAGAGDVHPLTPVKDLPLSRRQMVEIAKALARDPKILILDEATSALTAADVRTIFGILKALRDAGLAILYISHRMNEIAELAEDCSVFRGGQHIATFPAGTRSDEAIVEMMIGREYKHVFPPKPAPRPCPAVLAVRDLNWVGRLKNLTFTLGRGEIIGLGGLDGQGQRELLLALFGVLVGVTGTIEIDGRPSSIGSPRGAKSHAPGLALIPEDRKTEGLMLPMTLRENLSFAALERLSRFGLIDRAAETEAIDALLRMLHIRADALDEPVGSLSGGNQQKVVIGKWLMTKPGVILLNDPTRGIDVGTKQELYRLFRDLAEAGAAILFYSTDYDELIGCCDRVLVFYDGAIVRTLEGQEITERNLVASALNVGSGAPDPFALAIAGGAR